MIYQKFYAGDITVLNNTVSLAEQQNAVVKFFNHYCETTGP